MAEPDKVLPRDGDADPNVVVPRHVAEAARIAESFYQQEQTPEQIAAAAAAAPPADQNPPLAADQTPPLQAQPVDQNPPVPTKDQLQTDDWAGRYNSMKGRYDRSNQQIGSLQEQLIQAGDEIGRLNALISRAGVDPAAQPQNQPANHNNVITEADRDTYGEELLETMARIAKGATAPEIEALRTENADLKKRSITNDQKVLRQSLTAAVPNWMAIQASPQWRQWLHLPNVYTGVLRGKMLKEAYDAANSAVVIQTFQDFVKEVQATGGTVPTNTRQEQQAPPAPRQAAMSLDDLAAPGRAKPADGGNLQGSADKPIITRAQISEHYRKSRQGYYTGRQAEYDQTEAAIQSAQRDGRIRG
ncbi:MAG TPA: hypothetical protein VIJ94_03570 [Caulobacteraceae bacterium]